MARYVIAVLVAALIAASVFAILPVVADAPWESNSRIAANQPGRPTADNGDAPVSVPVDVEDAVRARLLPYCQGRIIGTDSEFLGGGDWEVTVQFDFGTAGNKTAVFRVRDSSLSVAPFNDYARYHCQP